ncbi:MAG: hypothetical protein ACI9LM_004707 [Alteromonadaceae bacterium]|jgi:hypothetical protein
MKILMVGPGYGSNMRSWIHHMDQQKIDDFHFLSTTKLSNEFKEYKNIKIYHELDSHNKTYSFFKIITTLKNEKFDLIYIHGAYNKKLVLLLCIIFKGKIVLNIWGQWFIDGLTKREDKTFNYFKFVAKRVNHIFVNWWDAYLQLEDKCPCIKNKLSLTIWGVPQKSINALNEKYNQECIEQYNIKQDDYLIFIPRGLLRHNNIHLIVEALAIIKEKMSSEEFNKIKIIIKTANAFDQSYYDDIKKIINKHRLKQVVVEEGMLDPIDYATLYNRANLSIYMSENDLLTGAVIDAIYSKTELILSDIGPYKELKERYNLDISICSINSEVLSDSILDKIYSSKKNHKLENIAKIGNDFVFEKNVINILDICRY